MPEQTAMYHFTVSPPRGPGQDDVSTLLRQVADTLDALGAVTVHDITFHVDMTEDGSWPLMSVYYEVDVSAATFARADDAPVMRDVDDRDAGDDADSITVLRAPGDDIEVIDSIEVIAVSHAVDDADDVDAAADPSTVHRLRDEPDIAAETVPPPPLPEPLERPAAYVDMISAFTQEPVGLQAVPTANDNNDDREGRDDTLAVVVELGVTLGADRFADDTVTIDTDPAAEHVETFEAVDAIATPDADESVDAVAATDAVDEVSAAPLAPTFHRFDQSFRQPAVHLDENLPESASTRPSTSSSSYNAWRTQLPADRTSLRRLKELWRTNSRRRNGT